MWILDSAAKAGKISSIQVAILMQCAKSDNGPKRVTELMRELQEAFEGYWLPKKGTIYPAVHNLHIRGFLKLHAVKPFGYSITAEGKRVVKSLMKKINTQMETYMQYYTFILRGYSAIDKEHAQKIRKDIIASVKDYLDKISQ